MNKKFKLEKDFIDFLRLCNEHGVKYLVVGGYAVSIHGYPRYTKDLDVCIESSDNNAMKMVDVIDGFGFSSFKLAKEDFLKRNFITQLGHEPLRIDILNEMDGVSFSMAWENRKKVNYQGVEINFIGYHELLILKKLANRPQDVADIAKLEERNKNK